MRKGMSQGAWITRTFAACENGGAERQETEGIGKDGRMGGGRIARDGVGESKELEGNGTGGVRRPHFRRA